MIYYSWNMKNLSTKSVGRQYSQFTSLQSCTLHTNLTMYVNTINTEQIDLLGLLEVTIGTGEAALARIVQSLGLAFESCITTNRTHITRKGEFNAIIYKQQFADGNQVDASKVTETLFPGSVTPPAPPGASRPSPIFFQNRVPVLFQIPFSNQAGKILQLITWHAPQPAQINPDNELKAFVYTMDYMINQNLINTTQPLVFSADFNFNTDPGAVPAWTNYIYNAANTLPNYAYMQAFTGLVNGTQTTLVSKDPTQKVNPLTPVDFDDLLANAYDNILVNTTAINPAGISPKAVNGVRNHLAIDVAGNQAFITFFDPANNVNALTLLIKNANKISDHCAVGAQIQNY